MANPANLTILSGRIVGDFVEADANGKNGNVFKHSDGTTSTVLLKIAVRDTFPTKGDYLTQFPTVECFVDNEKPGIFRNLKKGMPVTLMARTVTPTYERNGETVYGAQKLVMEPGSLQINEPKSATELREANQAAGEQA